MDHIIKKQACVEGNFEVFINGIGEEDARELIRIIDLATKIMQKKQEENGDRV